VPVADVVAKFLAKREGPAQRNEAIALAVMSAFARIGPPISDQAEAVMFRRGVLTLVVGASPWMTELALLERQILDRLEKMLGQRRVKSIRLRLGNVRRTRVDPAPPRPLSPKQAEDVAAWAESIADPDVRAAMVRAATVALGRQRIDGPIASGPPGPRAFVAEPVPVAEPRYGFGYAPVDRWKQKRKRKVEDE
jgi:hypothetical protein